MNREPAKWLMKHCKKIVKADGVYLKCECCTENSYDVFFDDHNLMILHLYEKHHISELTKYRHRKFLEECFDIKRLSQCEIGICQVGTCRRMTICHNSNAFPLLSHLIIYHTCKEKFSKVMGIESGHQILMNYFVLDTIAKCSFCWRCLSLEGLESDPAEVLMFLSTHWNNHYYKIAPDRPNKMSIQAELQKAEEISKQWSDNIKRIFEDFEKRSVRSDLMSGYKMTYVSDFVGQCTICLENVVYNDSDYLIKNHWEMYHGSKSNIYKDVIQKREVRQVLNKYQIDGSMAKCFKCDAEMDLEENIKTKLIPLLLHWHTGFHSSLGIKRKKRQLKNLRQKLRIRDTVKNIEETWQNFIWQLLESQEERAPNNPGSSTLRDDEIVKIRMAKQSKIRNTTTKNPSISTPPSKRRRRN
ncbi:hypothetical protein ALC56_07889 [Trachymyrmex septentrionalis]|uniref:Uncharacterized protein n=1 Tax=Trachymyrmex septentrionalis TaxID=34720 RepID=A0A195FAP5_9HYME|nr:PREDICTED: uncharacterized protein LOC108749918 [Trachymyrmex septentrionalis]KYN37690.1 hypothetical protein ALC56_07889 [Trachymyrmex septentrionalis]